MACMLYAQYKGSDIRLGRFRNREAAEEFFRLWLETLKSSSGPYPVPIFVESGKGGGSGDFRY